MLPTPVLAGIVAAAAALVSLRLYLRAASRLACPGCGARTAQVRRSRLSQLLEPWVVWRWCATCGWEGWARGLVTPLGPVRGRPPFRWRSPAPDRLLPKEQDAMPDHASGFRWGGRSTEDGTDPSGFHWKEPDPR